MMFCIRNYSNYATVSTRLVILKGAFSDDFLPLIQPHMNINAVVFKANSEIPNHDTIYPVKVTKDGFIALVELYEGLNIIKMTPGGVSEELHLVLHSSLPEAHGHSRRVLKPLVIISKECFDDADPELLFLLTQYLSRIQLGMELMQAFFAEKLYEEGYPRRSFLFDTPEIFKTEKTKEALGEMSSEQAWKALCAEIDRSSEHSEKTKYITFLMHPWKYIGETDGSHSALGGPGLALLCHDFLSIWPEKACDILEALDNTEKVLPRTFKTLTAFHESKGRIYGASLGQVAHELGHLFDLGHTEKGLMGTDFHRFSLSLMPPVFTKLPTCRTSISNSFFVKPAFKVYLPSGEIVEDIVRIAHSSAAILFYHRFFYPFNWTTSPAFDTGSSSSIIFEGNTIKSDVGITAIEIRDTETAQIIYSCTFQDLRAPPRHYSLDKRHVPLSHSNVPVSLVAQNEAGSILKATLHRNSLPVGVTKIRRRNP